MRLSFYPSPLFIVHYHCGGITTKPAVEVFLFFQELFSPKIKRTLVLNWHSNTLYTASTRIEICCRIQPSYMTFNTCHETTASGLPRRVGTFLRFSFKRALLSDMPQFPLRMINSRKYLKRNGKTERRST